MISVNLPENSQDSSQSALELLKPDPPLEQKAEAKIQGNLLKGIDNCSGMTLKGVRFLRTTSFYWQCFFISTWKENQFLQKNIGHLLLSIRKEILDKIAIWNRCVSLQKMCYLGENKYKQRGGQTFKIPTF